MPEKSLDILPQTVVEANSHGRITYVNQVGCDILGYSREELEQMRIFDLILPHEKSMAKERFKKKVMKELTETSN